MIEWKFILNGVEIEEPIGFDDIVFNVMRDDLWHGIFFEASTTQLSFYGEAFDILHTAKESYGVDAEVIFTGQSRCEGETDYTTVISGKLNFSNYQQTCGDQCLVRLSVEQNSCAMVFKNRFDQKVDIDTPIAFDKITNLVQYAGLGFDMELATQVIPISADAEVSAEGDPTELTAIQLYATPSDPSPWASESLIVRPVYAIVNDNSILTGELNNPVNIFEWGGDNSIVLSPQILLEENQGCINTEFNYEIRFKGTVLSTNWIDIGTNQLSLWLMVDYWDGTGSHFGPDSLAGSAVPLVHFDNGPISEGVSLPFDQTFSGTVSLPVGVGLYAYIKIYNQITIDTDILTADYDINFDPETSFLLYTEKSCPPTDAKVYLINETLARATESITDRCLTIESEYYGRTDSEPYAEAEDGCGSLRVLTPGLRIRQAADKNFFASMKELMEGLRAIDNIGMGMETDRVRIEPAEYFYQNTKILDILLIPTARSDIQERLVYSNLKTGYNKWEIKSIKGIDEFNSYKEFRTSIKSVNNELDITSNLIASGYIIETLRTQTLVNTGNTDNTYDNDVFIICVDRDAYCYHVEQGITENAANFFSPATAYNWRIRPLYNLMRWFKSIAQSYVNLFNTASKLFFTSGKGNYLAEGNISASDQCRMENKVMAENDDIAITDFNNIAEGTPIYKPETIAFTYPLSVAEYKLIKATPYGYFNVQCGTGESIKAYIKTLAYKPAAGTAEFTLIKSWQ